MTELDWTRWPNFGRHEFVCKCGCGQADMDPGFMDRLQALRTAANIPFTPTSGFRCEAHNKAVGGGPEHPMGMAVDIGISNPAAKHVVNLAVKADWPRIGVSQRKGRPRFLHLGTATTLPEAIWSY